MKTIIVFRNTFRGVVLAFSQDGDCTYFFENIRVSSLKRELSIDTHSSFSLVNTVALNYFFKLSFSVRGSSRKERKYISHFMLMKGGESINIFCVTKDINIASNKKCQLLTNFRSILFLLRLQNWEV